jgi:hypothetical protein
MALSTITSVSTTGVVSSGTAVNSTSGTSIDFTGIPSWVKRITVMFNGVSANVGGSIIVQLGSGSVQTTGYASSGSYVGASTVTSTATTGMLVGYGLNAGTLISGHIVLTPLSGNLWVCSSMLPRTNESYVQIGGGNVTLSGALDRIRITSLSGTDTFDAGSINILYE